MNRSIALLSTTLVIAVVIGWTAAVADSDTAAPETPDIHDTAAWNAWKQGNYAGAVEIINARLTGGAEEVQATVTEQASEADPDTGPAARPQTPPPGGP